VNFNDPAKGLKWLGGVEWVTLVPHSQAEKKNFNNDKQERENKSGIKIKYSIIMHKIKEMGPCREELSSQRTKIYTKR